MLNSPILNKITQSGIVAKFNIRVSFDVDPLEGIVDDPEIVTLRTERNYIVFNVETVMLNPAKIQYIRKHIEKELKHINP